MDEYYKNMLINALRKPDNKKSFDLLNQPDRTANNLPDQLNMRTFSSPQAAPHSLPSAKSIDLTGDRVSLQSDGKVLGGNYYAELNKPFNGDANANIKYLKPHKNGYLQADANLKPGDSSFFVNYKTNF